MPILPRGPAGSWDEGMVHTANTPLEVPRAETGGGATDEVWMYYGGTNHMHNRNPSRGERDHQFGLAKWRIDGFAALEDTDKQEDTITTKAIRFSGNQLTLNADIKPDGYIKVKIRPGQGGLDLKALSDPVTGDHQKHVVRWGGEDDIGNCADKEVILEFRINDAALYSLNFTPDG